MTAQTRPGDEVTTGPFERLGPYRLVHRLGEGGMGVVHLGIDPHGRAVAVKVLRPHIAHDPGARARLEREVDTLSRITDPRVAAVLDSDLLGDRPYLVTRYVAGPSLDDVVGAQGALRGGQLLRLGRGLVGALDAIHVGGVVHRDLKPGNVLMEDGDPVVIDFGIAHVADDIRLTSAGLVMGTPGYLSPEVISGGRVTEATDWWGWAATLAFAASGRPPFGRGPTDVVLDRVRRGQADLAGVDPRLTPLLQAALSPDPGRRPPAAEVVAALERYAVGTPATVVFAPGRSEPGAATPGSDLGPPPGWAVPPGADRAARHTPALATTSELPQEGRGARRWEADPGAAVEWDEQGWVAEQGAGWAEPWPEPWPEQGPSAGRADEQDPRIGRPMRTGTLAALVVVLAAAAATWPGVVLLICLAWCWVARFSDRSVTSLVLRRFDGGRRRSDVPMAILLGPWHLLTAAAGTVGGLLLPAVVALSAAFAATLGLSRLASMSPAAATPPALATGFLAGAVVAWWGPGGASLRRGSRSLVRGAVRPGAATDVVVGLLLAGAGALVVLALVRQGDVSWWPLPGSVAGALQAPAG